MLAQFTAISTSLLFSSVLYAQSSQNYDFQWRTIGAPNNPAYTGPDSHGMVTGRGSVPYVYRMSQIEVTSTQWVEFANAIGAIGDPFRIGEDALGGFEGGATGPNNTYHYTLQTGFPGIGQYPVSGTPWLNAARYCNWLHNGKQTSLAALETGAYDLQTYNSNPTPANSALIHREPNALFWLPTLDEWLKSGHFDPNGNGPGQSRWWQYSTTSDTAPISGLSPLLGGLGQTNAAFYASNPNAPYRTFLAGMYPGTQSPWGVLDMSGGVSEWLEGQGIFFVGDRQYDGSSLYATDTLIDRVDAIGQRYFTTSYSDVGVRIASAIPSPQTFCGCVMAFAWTTIRRRKS